VICLEAPLSRVCFRGLIVFLTGGAVCFAQGHVHAAPQEDLKELRGRIEALQKKLSASEESRKDAADALKDSEVAISEANRKLYQISNEQRAALAQVADIEAETKQLDGKTKSQKARIETLLRRRYMDGGQDSLKLILNGQDPGVISRQLHYYTYVSRARAAQVETLRGDLDRLADLRADATQHANRLAQLRDQEAGEKTQLEAQRIERKQLLAQISAQVGTQRKEIGRLQQDEKRLTRLIDQINQMLAKKREEARKHAEEARKREEARRKEEAKSETKRSKPAAIEQVEETPDDSLAGKAFAALKGQLHLPIKGELVNRFGGPRQEGGLTWKGLFIRAAEGQLVKAVADGRVVYADWLRGFGNLLIIDHGGGFMTLYGNNESLLRQVGDGITSGEAIAKVGNTGGNPDSGLYFELRQQGKPLDPLNWMAR
jgi:septal ring factor EnvC (AmiA/AmiB activator)